MERGNIIAAPHIGSVSEIYDTWRSSRVGNFEDFYKFMTTPSVERDEFIGSLGESVSYEFKEKILTTVIADK